MKKEGSHTDKDGDQQDDDWAMVYEFFWHELILSGAEREKVYLLM